MRREQNLDLGLRAVSHDGAITFPLLPNFSPCNGIWWKQFRTSRHFERTMPFTLPKHFLGTDEGRIIEVLSKRTSSQRSEISKKYKASFGKVFSGFHSLDFLFLNETWWWPSAALIWF